MRNAALAYVRVSTAEQAHEGVSLAAQEAKITAYCTLAGLDLVATCQEAGVSGAKPLAERPAGAELLERLARGQARHVVTLKLDRLFRDAADALLLTQRWDRADVALHLIDMGGQAINTGSAMGRMLLTVMAGFAELERNLIAERTALALAHLKAQGRHVGSPAFGLAMVDGELQANDDELVTAERMRELKAQNLTYQQIADTLTAEGRPTKRGGRWHPTTVANVLGRMGGP